MPYKTIILELLEQEPATYDRLKRERKLLVTMERCALCLKQSHIDTQERLARIRPGSSPEQIASEALELALQSVGDYLPKDQPQAA